MTRTDEEVKTGSNSRDSKESGAQILGRTMAAAVKHFRPGGIKIIKFSWLCYGALLLNVGIVDIVFGSLLEILFVVVRL